MISLEEQRAWSTSKLPWNAILDHVTSWCKSVLLQLCSREQSLAPAAAPRRRSILDFLWQNQRTCHWRFPEPEQEVCLYFHFAAACWPRTRGGNAKYGVTRFNRQVLTCVWCYSLLLEDMYLVTPLCPWATRAHRHIQEKCHANLMSSMTAEDTLTPLWLLSEYSTHECSSDKAKYFSDESVSSKPFSTYK